MNIEEERNKMEDTIREIVMCCTDEQLAEIAPSTVTHADGHEDAEKLGIKWDYMNDEVDAEDIRRYVAEYYLEYSAARLTLSKLLVHVWDRLYETLECQGFRRTPKGLIHQSDM